MSTSKPKPQAKRIGKPFAVGNNANPAGRPRKNHSFVARIREFEPELIERLRRIGMGLLRGFRGADQVRALESLLAYSRGRPKMAIELGADEDSPLTGILVVPGVVTPAEWPRLVAAHVKKLSESNS